MAIPKIKMIKIAKIAKIVRVEREDGVLCVTTPTQFPWEIHFHLVDDRGRVIVLKNRWSPTYLMFSSSPQNVERVSYDKSCNLSIYKGSSLLVAKATSS